MTQDLFAVFDDDPYEEIYCIFCDCNYLRRNTSKHAMSIEHFNNRVGMLIQRPRHSQLCKEYNGEECPFLFNTADSDGRLGYTCGIGFESVIHDDGELGKDENDLPMKPTSCIKSGGVVYKGRM